MNAEQRAALEESGFEALQRLYQAAIGHSGQCRVVARFLLGLYNGMRFPFDLSELRGLDTNLFEDCMALLRMDARLTRKEVHLYFDDGSAKFEALVQRWAVLDIEKLQATGDGAPSQPGTLRHNDEVQARLASYSHAPGYRDASLILDCKTNAGAAVAPVRLEVRLNHQATESLLLLLMRVHATAWRHGAAEPPLDAQPGEKRPSWLDQPVSRIA